MVDLTSYIMMLKSAQFSPLEHVVDFARIVGTTTDSELGTRSNTPEMVQTFPTLDENVQMKSYLIAPLWSLTLKDCFSCQPSSPSSPSKDSLFTEKKESYLAPIKLLGMYECLEMLVCSSVLVWDSYKYSPGEPLQ